MEIDRKKTHSDTNSTFSCSLPSGVNTNRPPVLDLGRSVFPRDAVARIFRPSRSVTTSGRARTKKWLLKFERRSPSFIDPLMGWTGGDDTLTQVELTFPTLAAAIAYAERQGLDYVVMGGSLAGKDECLHGAASESECDEAFRDRQRKACLTGQRYWWHN